MPETYIGPAVVLNAANQAALIPVEGYAGVAFQIQGTFSGTITFEATVHGAEFAAFQVVASTDASTPVTTATGTGIYVGSCAGYTSVRARMSAYTSGGASVIIRADACSPSPGGSGGGGGGGGGTSSAFGSAFPGTGTAAGFEDGSGDMVPASINADGGLEVHLLNGGSGGTSSDFGDPFPSSGTAIGIADPDGDMHALSAETLDYDTGAGTVLQTVLGIALPGNGGPVAGGTNTNPIQVGDAGGSITVDGSVVVSSSALPTGASTAAKQPALGTAGIASADVLSVQGIASMTPVQISQATASNLNAQVVGNIAHASADSGNPVKIGGKAATSLPTAVAANERANVLVDVYGRPFVRTGAQGPAGSYWDVQHAPSSNTLATVSQAAAGSGVRNVCTGFTVTLAATASAPSAVQIYVMVVDGATTGTTYLWRTAISLPAVAGAITSFVRSGLWLPGTVNTAMTIEFSAAGGANTVESVTMEGTTVAE